MSQPFDYARIVPWKLISISSLFPIRLFAAKMSSALSLLPILQRLLAFCELPSFQLSFFRSVSAIAIVLTVLSYRRPSDGIFEVGTPYEGYNQFEPGFSPTNIGMVLGDDAWFKINCDEAPDEDPSCPESQFPSPRKSTNYYRENRCSISLYHACPDRNLASASVGERVSVKIAAGNGPKQVRVLTKKKPGYVAATDTPIAQYSSSGTMTMDPNAVIAPPTACCEGAELDGFFVWLEQQDFSIPFDGVYADILSTHDRCIYRTNDDTTRYNVAQGDGYSSYMIQAHAAIIDNIYEVEFPNQ